MQKWGVHAGQWWPLEGQVIRPEQTHLKLVYFFLNEYMAKGEEGLPVIHEGRLDPLEECPIYYNTIISEYNRKEEGYEQTIPKRMRVNAAVWRKRQYRNFSPESDSTDFIDNHMLNTKKKMSRPRTPVNKAPMIGPKGRRGRPRKIPLSAQANSTVSIPDEQVSNNTMLIAVKEVCEIWASPEEHASDDTVSIPISANREDKHISEIRADGKNSAFTQSVMVENLEAVNLDVVAMPWQNEELAALQVADQAIQDTPLEMSDFEFVNSLHDSNTSDVVSMNINLGELSLIRAEDYDLLQRILYGDN